MDRDIHQQQLAGSGAAAVCVCQRWVMKWYVAVSLFLSLSSCQLHVYHTATLPWILRTAGAVA